MAQPYTIGIIGATGAVGRDLLELLVDRGFPAKEIRLFASARSKGKIISYKGVEYTVDETKEAIFDDLDLALFSAGSSLTKAMGWEAAKRGCVVIDNSSAFRQDERAPLIVPEINPEAAEQHSGLIANPNCSTIVALMGIYPLHREFGLKRMIASTYQAVSGAGQAGMEELVSQTKAWAAGEPLPRPDAFKHQIFDNIIPHVDVFQDSGYTKEEMKMALESRKIMSLPELRVSTTCVRVPVMRAHSVSLQAEFEKPVSVARAREVVAAFEGAELVDEPADNVYPMPMNYTRRIPCGVGRIRKDLVLDNGLALFVSGDQIWKGAALNAVQIAELLVARGWVN
ncbi:MAG: aspartate-semialdehyde dehydrogenase [Opitutales bacterium]|nr:aspartate-semialdehyde dehydrogenase [Opitutales bacterium]